MARFGRGFIQALTQPSYMGGLFTAAQNIGAAPALRAAAQEQQAMKDRLASFDPNTVAGLQGLAQFYQQQGDVNNAVKLSSAARDLAAQEASAQALSNMKT
jgi:hypothetical protein